MYQRAISSSIRTHLDVVRRKHIAHHTGFDAYPSTCHKWYRQICWHHRNKRTSTLHSLLRHTTINLFNTIHTVEELRVTDIAFRNSIIIAIECFCILTFFIWTRLSENDSTLGRSRSSEPRHGTFHHATKLYAIIWFPYISQYELSSLIPGPSLSWEIQFSVKRTTHWRSMVILNNYLLHVTVYHPTKYQDNSWST